MRTEKRPLNLAALGVNGPAEGTTSKSKNSGPQSLWTRSAEPSTFPGCAISSGRGDTKWRVEGSHGPVCIDRGSHRKWKKS